MKDKFFEGKDFTNTEFKALIPKYYPPQYQAYIREEAALLKEKVKGKNRVLEAGVGIGRIIPQLAPLVNELVGIDNAKLMIKKSKEIANKYQNVRIIKCDFKTLRKKFPQNYFDSSICVWNTLGNVPDEVAFLKNLKAVTAGSIFITVYLKGTLKNRMRWYNAVGVRIKRIDKKKEIFYTQSGLKSKSYSITNIKHIANKSGLKITKLQKLSGVMIWAELSKK